MFFLLVVFDLCRLCRIVLRLVLGLDLQQQLLDVRAVVEGLVHDEGKLRREAQADTLADLAADEAERIPVRFSKNYR